MKKEGDMEEKRDTIKASILDRIIEALNCCARETAENCARTGCMCDMSSSGTHDQWLSDLAKEIEEDREKHG